MTNIVLRLIALALTTSAIFSASSASAAQVIYSSSGQFDGSLDGTAFTGKLVKFLGTGDDADTVDSFGERTTPLSSLRFVMDGTTYDVDGRTSVFVSHENGFAGFVGDGDAGTFGILRFEFDPGVRGTPWPVTFFSDALTAPAATTGGALLLTAGAGVTFTNGDTMPAVPESSTWLLLIAGFGVVGIALRHRGRNDAVSRVRPLRV